MTGREAVSKGLRSMGCSAQHVRASGDEGNSLQRQVSSDDLSPEAVLDFAESERAFQWPFGKG